ncbi:MAG: chemotaxis protein CheW [Desulfovibrionaceae bacterium]|nr:chemotaxis protein CheW [Desulfovibrionaceae bacterium]
MVKTPEEYFQAQAFDPPTDGKGEALTPAEQAFVSKYMGIKGAKAVGIEASVPADAAVVEAVLNAPRVPLHDELKSEAVIQMVSFYLDSQVYTLPIAAVQEVIRYMPPTSLPLAPEYVAGVINLRGRVTPLLYLDQLITNTKRAHGEERFIIVCTRHGLQVGLIIDKVHTMYMVKQKQIIWNVESQIGANAEYLCGIVDINDRIFGIVSIDMIVDQVLQS